jgi:methionyl-tRNA formyltransferase
VLAAGARVSGATVHFVDEHYDRGAIAAQWPVPVLVGDTPETLARRVLRVEHRLLPAVLQAVAAGTLSLGADGRARGAPTLDPAEPLAFALHDDLTRVAADVGTALGLHSDAAG